MSFPLSFRVWSKAKSKWMSSIVLTAQGTPVLMFSEKVDTRVFHRVYLVDEYQPVIQWSTGLKDKNGVEIFEGDIVACAFTDGIEREGSVYWVLEQGRWKMDTESMTVSLEADKSTVVDTVVERAARQTEESRQKTAAAESSATQSTESESTNDLI